MKNLTITILALLLALVGSVQAQQRDRRADLKVDCKYDHCVSDAGRIWLVTRCGKVHTADNINSTWRTAMQPKEEYLSGPSLDRVAAFGDKVAVVAGFISRKGPTSNPKWDYELVYDFVLRTTDRGMTFDTVFFGKGKHWISGFCYHNDGRLWMGSSQATSPGALFFSADKGQTFITLGTDFDTVVSITAIEMCDSTSGMLGTHENQLYLTNDNWQTFRRLPTPKDQLGNKTYFSRPRIGCIRIWNNSAYVTQNDKMFCTSLASTPEWNPVPMTQCEVDQEEAALWYITDSGRLERRTVYGELATFDVTVDNLIRVVDGKLYASVPFGVLRISADGKVDTCLYYTTQKPIKEDWSWVKLGHGQNLWASDGKSVFLTDKKGWYRIAQLQGITALKSDPTSESHIIICLNDGTQRRIDTAGYIEPYRFNRPLDDFLDKGLQGLTIETYSAGCFHYNSNTITYRRNGDKLYEAGNNFDSNNFKTRYFPVATVEEALRNLSLRYDATPTAYDFGLEDTSIDVNAILNEPNLGWSTSRYGYRIYIVNSLGDSLKVSGVQSVHNDVGGRTRFPWLLPMTIDSRTTQFVSYQPCLWQALRPMMPDGMLLKNYLDNKTLRPHYKYRSGDLLFCARRNSDMEKAIGSSTGEYTHVAIVEVDSTGRVWIIEASGKNGVRRIELRKWNYREYSAYRPNVPIDTVAVIARAKSFIGQPYDDSFLPDNGKMYCSELVYEAYLDANGKHLFQSQPMNFCNKRGKMPKYWKKHFRELGIPIPEGVQGTNPTDMSKSELLENVL